MIYIIEGKGRGGRMAGERELRGKGRMKGRGREGMGWERKG